MPSASMGFCVARTRKGCRLDFGRRPVDLVSEKKVAEDGPELGGKVGLARVEDPSSHKVRWNEVRGELDSAELATDRGGKRTDGCRLRETWHSLDEDVTTREKRDQDALEQAILAHDDLADLEQQLFDLLGYARGVDLGGRLRASNKRLIWK